MAQVHTLAEDRGETTPRLYRGMRVGVIIGESVKHRRGLKWSLGGGGAWGRYQGSGVANPRTSHRVAHPIVPYWYQGPNR